jgi:hypothetical protein
MDRGRTPPSRGAVRRAYPKALPPGWEVFGTRGSTGPAEGRYTVRWLREGLHLDGRPAPGRDGAPWAPPAPTDAGRLVTGGVRVLAPRRADPRR